MIVFLEFVNFCVTENPKFTKVNTKKQIKEVGNLSKMFFKFPFKYF